MGSSEVKLSLLPSILLFFWLFRQQPWRMGTEFQLPGAKEAEKKEQDRDQNDAAHGAQKTQTGQYGNPKQ